MFCEIFWLYFRGFALKFDDRRCDEFIFYRRKFQIEEMLSEY